MYLQMPGRGRKRNRESDSLSQDTAKRQRGKRISACIREATLAYLYKCAGRAFALSLVLALVLAVALAKYLFHVKLLCDGQGTVIQAILYAYRSYCLNFQWMSALKGKNLLP